MSMDQNQASLLNALAKYCQSDAASFGVPGHKSGKGATDDIKRVIGAQAFKADATTWTNDHSCGA
jgi:arginine/lysine/ornithine decarboxylase